MDCVQNVNNENQTNPLKNESRAASNTYDNYTQKKLVTSHILDRCM